MKKTWKIILWCVLGLAGLFLLIQLVPYGHNHTNPVVVKEVTWDTPETRQLVKRTCYDCHSNETVWPWYSNVAPVSWLVTHDVDEGRSRMNFSDTTGRRIRAGELVNEINRGEMPPAIYLPMHPEARLTTEEKQQLVTGLTNSLK